MKKQLQAVIGLGFWALAGLTAARADEAPALPEATDQFLECLSIAEDQRQSDPDPKMQAHWAQYSDIYGANIYAQTQSIQLIFDNIQAKFDKWTNMRRFIPAQSVNNLALAVLNKCDEKALSAMVPLEPYQNALDAYLKARPAAAPAQ